MRGHLGELQSVFYYHDHENLETNPDIFFRICKDVLDKQVPRKKKYMPGNSKPLETKTLSKEIMNRTRSRERFLKNPNAENKKSYNKQRNLCDSLLRIEKRKYIAKRMKTELQITKHFNKLLKLFFIINLNIKKELL